MPELGCAQEGAERKKDEHAQSRELKPLTGAAI